MPPPSRIHSGGGTDAPDHDRLDWSRGLLKLAVCSILGVALAGMPLVLLGVFRPVPALVAVVVVGFLVWRRWRFPLTLRRHDRAAWLASIAAVAICLTAGAVNARFSGQHFLVERDPGVYAVTGKWLAAEGNLEVATSATTFGGLPELRYGADGFHPSGRGDYLEPQFMHLPAALLAIGDWIGGSALLLKTTPLIGALALLAVFAFSSLLLPRGLALAVMVALGISLPEVYFSRDTYSEPLAQLLLFAGLFALAAADPRRSTWRSENFFAGLLLGATTMARIDALFYLVPVGVYLIGARIGRLAGPPEPSRTMPLLAGMAGPVALAILDVALFAPNYVEDLAPELWPIAIALTGLLALSALVGSLSDPIRGIVRRLAAHRDELAWAAGAAVLVAGVVGASLRPWLGWYLGIPTVLLAVSGLAAATWMATRGRRPELIPFLLILGMTAAVYVVRPSISTEHIWAMRRFLPVVIPGLMITAFLSIDLVRRRAAGRIGTVPSAAATVLLSGIVLFPVAAATGRVATVRPQYPVKQISEAVCAALPADAAVLVLGAEAAALQHSYPLSSTFTVTLRAVCGVPAAGAPVDAGVLRRAAEEAARRGHQPFVLTQSGVNPLGPELPLAGMERVVGRDVEELERTSDRVPERVIERPVEVFLMPVALGS